MKDAEPTNPATEPLIEPDAVPSPVKNPRAQRLAAALRDNLRRRKAAGRTGVPEKPSN